jgi:YARHG domain
MRPLIYFAASVIASTLAAMYTSARAGDVQGDAYDCKDLWVMRNEIYKNAGYCFASAQAVNYFGNGGCRYRTISALPLSDQDRSVVGGIRKSERRQGC